MTEFSDLNLEITFGNKDGVEKTRKLGEMLTHAFTPEHLKK
jgi:cytidine deaminase